jgi:hypothetical protein
MIWKNAFMALALVSFATIAIPGAQTAEPAAAPDEEVPYAKLDEEGKNMVKLSTALKLKEIGWGKDVKGGKVDGYSLESLLAAARILRELPTINEIDPKEVETIPAKDAVKGEATPAQAPFSPGAEAKAIVGRARDIVDAFEDPKEKAAYVALIAAIEKIDNTKAIVGGPRIVNLLIGPGQTQHFHFKAFGGAPSAIVARGNAPLRYKMVRLDNNHIHYNQTVALGHYGWVPHANGQVSYRVIVHNHHRVPVSYMISVR